MLTMLVLEASWISALGVQGCALAHSVTDESFDSCCAPCGSRPGFLVIDMLWGVDMHFVSECCVLCPKPFALFCPFCGMEPLPDRGYLSLCRGHLVHTLTGERRVLEPTWSQLRFTEDGFGQLLSDDLQSATWAASFLTRRVLRDTESGTWFIVSSDNGYMDTIRAYFAASQRLDLTVRIAGAPHYKLAVTVFDHVQRGARVWWDLGILHTAVGLKGTASSWYQRHWPAWVARLAKLKLFSPHARKAVPISTSSHVDEACLAALPSFDDDHLVRLLPNCSLSTPALVVLVAGWSQEKANSFAKQETHVKCWANFLEGLIRTWIGSSGPASQFTIGFNQCAFAEPGCGDAGADFVVCSLDDSCCVSPLEIRGSCGLAKLWRQEFGPGTPLAALLQKLVSRGKVAHGLLQQVVLAVSNIIEQRIARQFEHQDPPASKRSSAEEPAACAKRARESMDLECIKYYFASRNATHEEPVISNVLHGHRS